jgi:uncharacterized protein (DUF1778 family)
MALPKRSPASKPRQVNIRMTEFQAQLLEQAAEVRGKNRTDFILGAAIREARETLEAHTTLFVDDATFEAFQNALGAPIQPTGELRSLFASRPPWE